MSFSDNMKTNISTITSIKTFVNICQCWNVHSLNVNETKDHAINCSQNERTKSHKHILNKVYADQASNDAQSKQ